MDTVTTTKSVTNTHLAIATLAMLGAGAVALAVAPVGSSGNTVALSSTQVCQQLGSGYGYNQGGPGGVQITDTQTGKSYQLTNGCRNAGHGMRNYTLTCVADPHKYYVSWNENCGTATVQTGNLQVSIDARNVPSKLYIAGMDRSSPLLALVLTASNDDVAVQSFTLTQLSEIAGAGSYLDYQSLTIEDTNGAVLGSIVPTGNKVTVRLNNALVVPKNTAVTVWVRGKFTPILVGQNGAKAGDRLGWQITSNTDITATGLTSGVPATVTLGNTPLAGYVYYLYRNIPFVLLLNQNTNQLNNGTNDILKFNLQTFNVPNADIDVAEMTFYVTSTKGVLLSNLSLYDVTDSVERLIQSNIPVVNGIVKAAFSPITVSPSVSRTLALRATITGVQSASAVTARINGDANLFPTTGLTNTNGILNNSASGFAWSDRTAMGHSTSTMDWVNGFKVDGLTVPGTSSWVLTR